MGTGAELSTPVSLVLIHSAGSIARQRPALIGRLLPSLLKVAMSNGLRDDSINADGPVPMPAPKASMAYATKTVLLALLKLRDDAAEPWRDRLHEALSALGAREAADSAIQRIEFHKHQQQKREEAAAAAAAAAAIKARANGADASEPDTSASVGDKRRQRMAGGASAAMAPNTGFGDATPGAPRAAQGVPGAGFPNDMATGGAAGSVKRLRMDGTGATAMAAGSPNNPNLPPGAAANFPPGAGYPAPPGRPGAVASAPPGSQPPGRADDFVWLPGNQAQNPAQILQLIGMLAALAAKGEAALPQLEVILTTLPPSVLADVVIYNMQHLPASLPPAPAAGVVAGGVGVEGAAGPGAAAGVVDGGAPGAATATAGVPRKKDPRKGFDPRRADAGGPPAAAQAAGVPPKQGALPLTDRPGMAEGPSAGPAVPPPIRVKTEETEWGSTGGDAMDVDAGGGGWDRADLGAARGGRGESPPAWSMRLKQESGAEPSALGGSTADPAASVASVAIAEGGVPAGAPARDLDGLPLDGAHAVGVSGADGAGGVLSGAGSCVPGGGVVAAASNVPPIVVIPPPLLSPEEAEKLQRLALHRIVDNRTLVVGMGRGLLHTALLAKLVSQPQREEELENCVRELILRDYNNYHELATQWLFCLFTRKVEAEMTRHQGQRAVGDEASEDAVQEAAAAAESFAQQYERLMLALMASITRIKAPTDRWLSRLLLEAPLLPPAVTSALDQLCTLDDGEAMGGAAAATTPATPVIEHTATTGGAQERDGVQAMEEDGEEGKSGDAAGPGGEGGPLGAGLSPEQRATLGLSTARDLLFQRPSASEACLGIVLRCAISPHEGARGKAIRLVASKLFPVDRLACPIESFARDQLLRVARVNPHQAGGLGGDAVQGPTGGGAAAAAAGGVASGGGTGPSKVACSPPAPGTLRRVPSTAAAASTSEVSSARDDVTAAADSKTDSKNGLGGVAGPHPARGVKRERDEGGVGGAVGASDVGADDRTESSTGGGGGGDGGARVGRVKRESGGEEARGAVVAAAVTEAEATRFCSLYLALVPRKPELIEDLLRVYAGSPNAVKQVLSRTIAAVPRAMGASCASLTPILSRFHPGSEALLFRLYHTMVEPSCLGTPTSTGAPSESLVALASSVKQLYETQLRDVRLLIPFIFSLKKEEVLQLLPKFVDLSLAQFKAVLARVLELPAGTPAAAPAAAGTPAASPSGILTPAELLLALHNINPKADAVPLKKVLDACGVCFQQTNIFTADVLAKVLNQLVEQDPLPLLFMRTVIQSISAFPKLTSFIMDILSRMVSKQVWKQPKQWEGFLKCAKQTAPHSFPVLLQLPPTQLEDCVAHEPDVKAPLAEYIRSSPNRASIPRLSLEILGITQDGHEKTIT
eukprot:jgi/Mesvir1/25755/Mv01934-RA.1